MYVTRCSLSPCDVSKEGTPQGFVAKTSAEKKGDEGRGPTHRCQQPDSTEYHQIWIPACVWLVKFDIGQFSLADLKRSVESG